MGQGSLCYTVGRGEYVIVEGEESIKVREGESIIAGEQESVIVRGRGGSQ